MRRIAAIALPCLSALAALTALAVPAPASPPHRLSVPRAAAAPPTDGPVIAEADPFTTDAPGLSPGQIEMTTISTRPSLVSGPDVRVEVRGLDASDTLTVTRDGTNVSGAFVALPGRPGVVQGVVPGLRLGTNVVVATAAGSRYGPRTVTLVVTDHSLQGPVVSGPHQEPFVCETAQSDMGPSQAPDCVAPTQIHWWRMDLLGNWSQLADPYAPYPAGTATTTVGGRTVPVVVRIENIVINRGIARIGVLDDPAARGPNGSFSASEWNHRVLWRFGESCGTGFHQGTSHEDEVFSPVSSIGSTNLAGPFMDLSGLLRGGWMVAQSTLTTFGVHCNQVLSAETLMMTKEHIIDEYGTVDHTVGAGASGGAIQQYTIGDQYPGLLDAGTPLLSFPDVVTTAMTVHDCVLFNRVFAADPGRWNALKQIAVTGLATPQVCQDWASLFGPNLKPGNCPDGIPPSARYDPTANPDGVRCDLQDDLVNELGRDPSTGMALRPVDNEGVQYGLVALQQGQITPDDFVTLNQQMGGFDLDGNFQAQRTTMPASLAARMYQLGFITGRGALTDMAVIDQSIPVSDLVPELDIHDQIRPFETQARLQKYDGGDPSQVIWLGVPLPSNAITTADQWLDGVDAALRANPSLTRAQAIAQARPATAGDQCRVIAVGVPDLCNSGLLRHSGPRQVAGGSLAEDDIKCQLQPVSAATEPSSLSTAQLDALRQVFPGGVCDWSKPSVGFTAKALTWQAYPSPGTNVTVPYTLVRSSVPAPAAANGDSAVPGGARRTLAYTGDALWARAALAAALFAIALASGAFARRNRRRVRRRRG